MSLTCCHIQSVSSRQVAVVMLCSERDELASRLALINVHVQQLSAREADAYQQVKACIELAEQSQMDMSQV